ncbi:CPS-53 (KpLE1) prophage protein [Escherichia coli]|uniref:CPS-53 (KpLE1) prophage protein n=1 Tax=Escherichia coli TaxID=562 RepID=A0A2X3KDJ8_ECOLX|nr:CPS-53 (KpLE1) prophage protein [Escherichia coli]
MNTKTKGKVSLNLEIEPFDENRVKIKHKLSYVRPTNRGKISEEDTTETPMYVNRGGRLTILQEDQGQLLTLAGEPDGKLRAAVVNIVRNKLIIYLITEYLYIVRTYYVSELRRNRN